MPKSLLLIGGGHSHVEVIRRWGLVPEPDVAVTLISPDRHTPYSGMLPGYIAGHYSHADCHIDLDAVCAQAGVTRIGASVGAVDFAARIARCSHAPDQPFDVLSIDTGSTPVLAPIPGAERHGIAVKPVAQFLEHWAQLREAAPTAPRPLQVVVVGAGAAGVEVVLAMQHRIAGDGGRAIFTLIGDGPTILGVHPRSVQQRFMNILQHQGISVRLDTAVERVAPGALLLRGGERLVRVDPIEGKPARTLFRRLRRFAVDGLNLTLVEAHLITGRTHQIRVHAAHLGTPLAGDPKYGDEQANRSLKACGLSRLFLHASALIVRLEYMTGPLRVEAPLPDELEQILSALEAQT